MVTFPQRWFIGNVGDLVFIFGQDKVQYVRVLFSSDSSWYIYVLVQETVIKIE